MEYMSSYSKFQCCFSNHVILIWQKTRKIQKNMKFMFLSSEIREKKSQYKYKYKNVFLGYLHGYDLFSYFLFIRLVQSISHLLYQGIYFIHNPGCLKKKRIKLKWFTLVMLLIFLLPQVSIYIVIDTHLHNLLFGWHKINCFLLFLHICYVQV